MFKFFLLFFIITTLLTSQEIPNPKKVSLVLSWKHQFQFAGYYMAKEMGYYEEAGLEVAIKEYDLKINRTKAVASAEYEFGIGHSSLILDKLNHYRDIKFLAAIHQSSPLILLGKKRDDLKTLQDIKNKKVMLNNEEKYSASINAMLMSEGITSNSYIAIQTSFNPIDIVNGNTDLMLSYTSVQPYTLKEKGIEVQVFNPKDYGYDFYSDILFTSSKMINENPQVVQNFYTASMKGWEYAYSYIDKTIELILSKYNTQNKTKDALLFEAYTLKELAFVDKTPFGDLNTIKLKEMCNTFRLLGLVQNNTKTNYDEFIYKLHRYNYQPIEKRKTSLFIHFYKEYSYVIHIALFLLLGIFITSFYFRYRLKALLKSKSLDLQKSLELFDNNISASKTDLQGNIVSVTKAFCKVTGYTKKELIGKNHRMLRAKDSLSVTDYKDLWLTIHSGHTWRGEFKNINKDGSIHWVESIISPIFDKKNQIIGYEGIRHDITGNKILIDFNKQLEEEVKKQTITLTKLATTDKLTGIYNRVKIDDDLKSNYEYFQKHHEVFSIILIDIDFFKAVNDTYGHQIGDIILKEVSVLVKSQIRVSDTLGRWGGEEFMIICPNTRSDGAYALASNIRKAVEGYKFSRVNNLSISAGICSIKDKSDINYIISCADSALYRAKDLGRNRVER